MLQPSQFSCKQGMHRDVLDYLIKCVCMVRMRLSLDRGFTLVDGSLVYHLGLLLLLGALSYGLLAVGVRSQSLGFRGTL